MATASGRHGRGMASRTAIRMLSSILSHIDNLQDIQMGAPCARVAGKLDPILKIPPSINVGVEPVHKLRMFIE